MVSAILGLSAVILTTSGEQKAMLFFAALCIVAVVAARVVFPREIKEELTCHWEPPETTEETPEETTEKDEEP